MNGILGATTKEIFAWSTKNSATFPGKLSVNVPDRLTR